MNIYCPTDGQYPRIPKSRFFIFLFGIVFLLGACSERSAPFLPAEMDQELAAPEAFDNPPANDKVTLQESTIRWDTYPYQLNDERGIVENSFNKVTKTQRIFKTYILENRYLRVTLLPEWGGRIISMIYKPTGHEQLYRNPVGVPYQIGTGVFYYDWLMVYGGIFPTFPEPEHGKTWLLPWDFQVVSVSDQEITVAMSIQDEIDNASAPPQYDLGATGLEVTYFISLKAGRAAIDTTVQITNPGDQSVDYEYWTNTTLAPGSDPNDPKTTAGAEIIAPVEKIKIPRYWQAIAAQEETTGFIDVSEFVNLRRFENWPDMGIAYAFPDVGEANFWGVINHDNEEGIFRIADNALTPGLKIWTWGYPQSAAVDVQTTTNEARPYIELWAGVTREFWQRASFPPNDQIEIDEIYSPSIGLSNVTHANEDFLVNMSMDNDTMVRCQLFGMFPDQPVEISMYLDDQEFHRDTALLDATQGNDCSTNVPVSSSASTLKLLIESPSDLPLFEGELRLSNEP